MSALDEKLREAIRYIANEDGYVEIDDLEKAVTQIKQAFADEGYTRSPHAEIKAKMEIHGMMTGQDWYDSFLVELKTVGWTIKQSSGPVLEAAKKAAGME